MVNQFDAILADDDFSNGRAPAQYRALMRLRQAREKLWRDHHERVARMAAETAAAVEKLEREHDEACTRRLRTLLYKEAA